ncbi:MAG: LysM peptidoglycan-binding domain-containing protein [Phycisphaerales bacterium]
MDATTRIGIACLSLVLIWIVVYWATPGSEVPPQQQPRVTYQQPSVDPDSVLPPSGGDGRDTPAPADRTPIRPVQPEREPEPAPEPEQADPEPRRTVGEIIPPVFVEYTVQQNDNAWTVSERFYGTRDHWAAVLLSNPTVDARRLFRVGSVIKVAQDPRNIQGLRVGEDPPQVPRMEYIEYLVERGDTLSSISQAIYGRAGMWEFIQSANADQVNSQGTNLRPGMILKIPPPPAN